MRISKNPVSVSLMSTIGQWVHRHHTATYAIIAVLVVTIAALVSLVFLYKQPTEQATSSTTTKRQIPEPVRYYSPLTGMQVPTEPETKRAVTAIMLENSPAARPQSGLKAAGVVFEAIAEGGVTRFLALYQQEKPPLIGPVRSLRPYYIDWLAPFEPSVAHVGGSKLALDEIRNGSYRDIDEFFNSQTYWRASDRYAPHNVYTSFEKLDALNQAKGYTDSTVSGFMRKDPAPAKTPTATHITVTISGPPYNSTYTYDATSNSYARSQAGAPHIDREDGPISPTTVVVLYATMDRVMEDGYRERIQSVGNGRAVIFQDGTATETTWHKPSKTSQFTFTDTHDTAIDLNRGQTWIAVVPTSSGDVSWQ
ncbi:MAG: DUF3048 domain-containing protein [Candidatus Saccharimonadales bacterium]